MNVGGGAARGLATQTEVLCGRLAVTLGLSSLLSEFSLPIPRSNLKAGGETLVGPNDPFNVTSCGFGVGVRLLFVSVSVSLYFCRSPCPSCLSVVQLFFFCFLVSLCFLFLVSVKSSVGLTP